MVADRSFSLWATAGLAAVFGALSPLALSILMKLVGWEVGRWVFWLFFLAVAVLLQCLTRKGDLRWGIEGVAVSVLPMTPLALGWFGSVWCFGNHVCMGGHMQHPPYPAGHAWVDLSWAGLLVVAALLSTSYRSPSAFMITAFSAFLISYRFLFHSFGGIFWFPI